MRRALAAVLLLGCTSDPAPAASRCAPSEVEVSGACLPRIDDCGESGAPVAGGGCVPAGVPADGCGEGFSHDGAGGCAPIVPDAPCKPGEIAVLGDTSCHPIVDCGTDPYGSPPGAHVIHVDATAAAGGDGSLERPFSALVDAIAAAGTGDTVALAAGTYRGAVFVRKSITLWGRCPSMVSVVGQGGPSAAALVFFDKSDVHRIAITGDGVGFGAADATDVLLTDAWIHDLPSAGAAVQTMGKDASLTVRHSVVERTASGIGTFGGTLTIESTHIRDIVGKNDRDTGVGVDAQSNVPTKRQGTVTIRRSVIERTQEAGVVLDGANGTVEGTLIRDVAPRTSDKYGGDGIAVLVLEELARSSALSITSSVITRTARSGIGASGSTLSVARTTITDTVAAADDRKDGCAIVSADGSTAQISESLFAHNQTAGLLLFGDAHVERVLVRDPFPEPAGFGGMGIVAFAKKSPVPTIDVVDSAIVRAELAGIVYNGAKGSVSGCNIQKVKANMGAYGDGIQLAPRTVGSTVLGPDVAVDATFITSAERVGISAFGGCRLSIGSTTLRCNAIDLAYADILDPSGTHGDVTVLDDRGGNLCGCDATATCRAQASSDLAPVSLSP